MLSGIALVALLAQAPAAKFPTVTTSVRTSVSRPAPDPVLSLLRNRLKLEVTPSTDLFISDRLWTAFRSATLGVRLESRPDWMPGTSTPDGLSVGHGLFLGHPPMPRAEMFPYRDYVAAKPGPLKGGAQVGFDATFFVTPTIGFRFDVKMGGSMSGALSLVYKPRW